MKKNFKQYLFQKNYFYINTQIYRKYIILNHGK